MSETSATSGQLLLLLPSSSRNCFYSLLFTTRARKHETEFFLKLSSDIVKS